MSAYSSLDLYTDGRYFELNPTWHIEDSAWKAKQIFKSIQRNHLNPNSVCEVGCGAGEVLSQLQDLMPRNCSFTGYEVSPQAFRLCEKSDKAGLKFRLTDALQDNEAYFDLVLAIDVFEHVEDYLSFLRELRKKGLHKIFHIPLDLSVQAVLRSTPIIKQRQTVGHKHHFTKDTALASLKETGYEIVDYFYTPYSFECRARSFKRWLLGSSRKICYALNADLTVRIFGGWSLMVLTR